MMKPLTVKLVLEAVEKVFEKVAEDGGPPVAITVIGAEGNVIVSIASDVVNRAADSYTAMIAQSALYSKCHTIELPKDSSIRACSPWFQVSTAGGVVIRSGDKGQIVAAVAVTGRHDIAHSNEPIGGNHNLAIVFADSLGEGYYAVSTEEEYIKFMEIKNAHPA